MKKSDILFRLRSRPNIIKVRDIQVKCYAFNGPFVAHKTPVVILADSLMRPTFFSEEVEKLLKDRPLFVIDTTTMRTNNNLETMSELSTTLKHVLEGLGVQRSIVMGMGLSFPLAYQYATQYEAFCDKLIIGGVTSGLRDSIKIQIQQQIDYLNQGDQKKFAQGMSLLFSNFNFKDRMDRSESYRTVFENYLRKMDTTLVQTLKTELEQYTQANLATGLVTCPALIIQAEYDSVTTCHEGFQFSKKFQQPQLAILECLDHLAPLQNKKVMVRLLRRFLSDESLSRMTGVELYNKKNYPLKRMQLTPRYQFQQVGFIDAGNGVLIPVEVVDINRNGCRLFTTFVDHKDLKGRTHFKLTIPDRDLETEILLFDRGEGGSMRAVFVHDDTEQFKRFENVIELIAMEFEEVPLIA